MAFQETLKQLRGKHKNWAPVAKEQMDEWERDWHELAVKKDYAEHPLTVELIQHLKEDCIVAKRRLINERFKSEADRAEVQGDIKRMEWFLQLYTVDYSKTMAELEETVLNELQ